jgi:2-keto-3-deoxy-L-rhamnonate aldolase RhmA
MSATALRELMRARPVLGTFLKLPRPEVVDVLALTGFDFIICDLEHARIDQRDWQQVLLAARAHGLPVIVRTTGLDRGEVNHLLEGGAAGIQLPRTQSPADVAALTALTRFPPTGSRSVGVAHLGAGYGAMPLSEYIDDERDAPLLVGQLETRDLHEPLTETLRGLDVAFVGTVDLSVECGAPGALDHPAVAYKLATIEQAAAHAATTLGAFAPTPAAAARFAAAGYRYLAVAGDLTMLTSGAERIIDETRAALDAARATATQPSAS